MAAEEARGTRVRAHAEPSSGTPGPLGTEACSRGRRRDRDTPQPEAGPGSRTPGPDRGAIPLRSRDRGGEAATGGRGEPGQGPWGVGPAVEGGVSVGPGGAGAG